MTARIIVGDALAALQTLDSESVQVCVTSPPYYGLRDYGVDGQIGMEQTPAEFVARLLAVFEEVKRVLRPDGLCFVNIGDSYAGSGKGPSNSMQRPAACLNDRQLEQRAAPTSWIPVGAGLKPKDLSLIPQRFAIAMQDAGWWVRSEIVWAKTSAMPESVKDRPTSAWEPIWMFAKSRAYFWDQEAVRQPNTEATVARHGGPERRYADHKPLGTIPPGHPTAMHPEQHHQGLTVNGGGANGANLRNVWLLSPEPSREEHYAAFPTEIPRRCILAGTSEKGACPSCGAPWARVTERPQAPPEVFSKRRAPDDGLVHSGSTVGGEMVGQGSKLQAWLDAHPTLTTGWAPSCQCDAGAPVPQTVLDPFLGSGTTALVADRLGRHAIGIELSPTYAEMAQRRLDRDAPMLSEPAHLDTAWQQPDLFAEAVS